MLELGNALEKVRFIQLATTEDHSMQKVSWY